MFNADAISAVNFPWMELALVFVVDIQIKLLSCFIEMVDELL